MVVVKAVILIAGPQKGTRYNSCTWGKLFFNSIVSKMIFLVPILFLVLINEQLNDA